MKKLLLTLLVVSGLAYADDCTSSAQPHADAPTIVKKLQAHSIKAVKITYSADQATKANSCKTAISKVDSSLTIEMNQASGSDVFKVSKG